MLGNFGFRWAAFSLPHSRLKGRGFFRTGSRLEFARLELAGILARVLERAPLARYVFLTSRSGDVAWCQHTGSLSALLRARDECYLSLFAIVSLQSGHHALCRE